MIISCKKQGSDAAALETKAEQKDDYYIINGQKSFISGGNFNDLYFVMTRTGPHKTKGNKQYIHTHTHALTSHITQQTNNTYAYKTHTKKKEQTKNK